MTGSSRHRRMPCSAKKSPSTSDRSSAERPSKKLLRATLSYAGRGSAPITTTSRLPRAPRSASSTRRRWPTMPLPITTRRSGAWDRGEAMGASNTTGVARPLPGREGRATATDRLWGLSRARAHRGAVGLCADVLRTVAGPGAGFGGPSRRRSVSEADVLEALDGFRVVHVERLELVDQQLRHHQVPVPLAVSGHDVPRRVVGGGLGDGGLV